jgi:sterol desaturase/sphingolipid hydroxylase (fatty acid hydroxylase superfamily)
MIGVPVALLTSAAFEWWAHRYVLHGSGKRRGTFWAFHFHEHHRASRQNRMIDEDYRRPPFRWNAQGKELLALGLLALPVLAVAPWVPFWSATSLFCIARYYRVHRRAHLDPDWARAHLPWHYDHHLGPDQDKNWGVTSAWFDRLMGTRAPYRGTPREEADLLRRAARDAPYMQAEEGPEVTSSGPCPPRAS